MRPDRSVRRVIGRGLVVGLTADGGGSFIGVAYDATEQLDTRDRLEQVLRTMSDALVSVHSDWGIAWLNTEAERLLGRPAADLVGVPLWEALPETAVVAEHYRRAMELGQPATFEQHVGSRTYEVRAWPQPEGLALSLLDLTDRRFAEQERERASQEREQAVVERERAYGEAEAATLRMALLSDATARLSASLEPQQVLQALADTVVPALGAWIAVVMPTELAGFLREDAPADGDLQVVLARHSQSGRGAELVEALEALDLLRERIRRHAIDCEWRDGYLGLATSPGKGAALARWADGMQARYGFELQRIAPQDMGSWIASPRFHSGVLDPRSGHLHPLKYARGLARAAAQAGVRIHEHSAVLSLTQGTPVCLRTAAGEVRAARALLAGNVYLEGLAPALAARVMPVGTYIACTEALGQARADALIPSRAAVCDTNLVLDYFRTTHDHRMLYGGRVSYSTRTPRRLAQSMQARMVQTFPQLAGVAIDYTWGGFVDITMNRAPDFGRLPHPTGAPDNIYYLQGFSGHGLALSGLAGVLVAEAMAGDAQRFDVYARLRHRRFPGGRLMRTPALVLGMAWARLRDMLG